MVQQKEAPTLRQHITALLVAVAVISIFSAKPFWEQYRASLVPLPPVDIFEMAIEHENPVSIGIAFSSLQGAGILDIRQESKEIVYISLPSQWERREVRGALLSDVVSEESSFGFTRWHLPPHASVSFRVPVSPDEMHLHNPSSALLKVTLTRVDLQTEMSESDVILVQESPIRLW